MDGYQASSLDIARDLMGLWLHYDTPPTLNSVSLTISNLMYVDNHIRGPQVNVPSTRKS